MKARICCSGNAEDYECERIFRKSCPDEGHSKRSWKSIYHVVGCSNFPSAKTNRTGTCTLANVWGLNRHLINVLRHETSKLQSPVVLSIFIESTRPVSGLMFKRNTPAPVLYSFRARVGK